MQYSKGMPKKTRRQVPYVNLGGDGPRYTKPRHSYPWKTTELGQKALVLIYKFGTTFGTDDDFIRTTLKDIWKKKRSSASWQDCCNYIEKHLPGFHADFYAKTGRHLTSTDVSGRWANMWRDNDRKTHCIGPEHPKNHKALQPWLDWASDIF